MQQLSSKTRSYCNGKVRWEDTSFEPDLEDKVATNKLIEQANCVPLSKLFSFYHLHLDEYNRKIICPFPSHKESTASFNYYPETNTYSCYGCQQGHTPVSFVRYIENISSRKSAQKILDIFSNDLNENLLVEEPDDFNEKIEVMLQFSNLVRDFRKNHLSIVSQQYIEEKCELFDDLYQDLDLKYNLEALKKIVQDILLPSIINYKGK